MESLQIPHHYNKPTELRKKSSNWKTASERLAKVFLFAISTNIFIFNKYNHIVSNSVELLYTREAQYIVFLAQRRGLAFSKKPYTKKVAQGYLRHQSTVIANRSQLETSHRRIWLSTCWTRGFLWSVSSWSAMGPESFFLLGTSLIDRYTEMFSSHRTSCSTGQLQYR